MSAGKFYSRHAVGHADFREVYREAFIPLSGIGNSEPWDGTYPDEFFDEAQEFRDLLEAL